MPRKRGKSEREKAGLGIVFRKTKRVSVKVPKDISVLLKKDDGLLKKYNIYFQELFDYLIVTGVCHLDAKVLKYIDENIEPYIERFKKSQMAKLGKGEAPPQKEYFNAYFHLYENDLEALGRYLVEKGYKKQWVFEVLMQAFADENPMLIELIQRAKKAQVREKKKIVARLANDEWINTLQSSEAKVILDKLTQKYEECKFEELLQEQIAQLQEAAANKKIEELDVELDFEKKMRSLRMSRMAELNRIIEKPMVTKK